MSVSDSDEKRQEVARVYARMTDGELLELAEDAWSLTTVGKDALRIELIRRGLKPDLSESPALDSEIDDFVVLRRFTDLGEAELVKSLLESAGIECVLRDHNIIGMNWGWAIALGGIKVCVRREEADSAGQILGEQIPDRFDVPGIGQYHQPRCPNCQSLDISRRDWNRTHTGFVMEGSSPGTHRGYIWSCNSCSHEWPESDDLSTQDSEPQ